MAIKLSKNGKRLGRPPKNKNNGTVFISQASIEPKKEEIFIEPSTDSEPVIECDLVPISQFAHMNNGETKSGRYMTSVYSIKGFGQNKWIVGAYLKADWDKYKVLKWHDSEVVKRCVNYLNSITINKKGKKKYGNLELYKFNRIVKSGEEVIVAELIIDDRKNENFWGEGERM
jgi:hypothetical protein